MRYRGRFAPSPTGPLHFGSLVAAVASYLEARRHGGEWLVRIEDIDGPRCQPEWADDILRTLEDFEFEWDGQAVYQRRRTPLYLDALRRLDARGLTYPCACTRKEIADSSLPGIEGPVYQGICRNGLPAGRSPRGIRVRSDGAPIFFSDAIQGEIRQDVEKAIGDFIVERADGLLAYQLAVTVDDAEQAITHVVRGADLLFSTPRQIHLQKLLGLPTPHYAHLPVALNAAGEKLSKQTAAPAIDGRQAVKWLSAALKFLGHNPPGDLPLPALWQWSFQRWNAAKIPKVASSRAPSVMAGG